MMRISRKLIVGGMLSVFVGLSSGCAGGPLGPFPGGRLQGVPAVRAADWAGIGESEICEIETNPKEPYSVTVSCTLVDGQMYVNAGGRESPWAANVIADPNVRLRLDGKIYPVRAVRVEDKEEIARFGKVWTSQGFFLRDPTQFSEVWLFRLVP
ncbi:MAG: nitroreductase/quinone reductase family protein [Candidatus Binatia bacterium]|jgi:hypothetical protein|nr:nitroreductase/quinone reductase family protein [Candidatus Binatia bacterium]MDG2008283.1 nitroreductase/quinone reductase family protein [Candidatus Binatia bacterium]